MDIGIVSAPITLESRYLEHDRPVLLSGIQAMVRVLLEQSRLDRARGWNTGGLASGYRGSPLGGLDQELWRREALLTAAGVRFQPGLNEDLAATMLWGSQQLESFPGQKVEGVFGLWYGKGPGVDRSADALRCANMVGTSAKGGVLAVAGDDHAANSSIFPHQTDHIFEAVMMPVLQPADVGEILEFGLAGIAMSRFSGLWVALKTIAETAEQAAVVSVPERRVFVRPEMAMPPHGLNYDPHLRWPAERAQSERRMMEERLPAALAWARANRVNRLMAGSPGAPVGIVTVGKAHHDATHALRRLGLAQDGRLAVFKVGMSWPLDGEALRAFARGKRALVVVEEKRPIVEGQLRAALYDLPADVRPAILGKVDARGAVLMPAVMELSPELVAAALARVLPELGVGVEAPALPVARAEPVEGLVARVPAFCAGCPHNTGTTLPEGSHATAGIGCHIMALGVSPETRTFSQMGGEGVGWVGMAPFTDTPHMFVNMGDGTYEHSGLLAIRQAVAAKAAVTYKILFNDAVAMTGGQPAENGFTPVDIARQVAAEGVSLVALVADDPARLPPAATLPAGTIRDGRDNLDAVQRRMREHPGVSVLIYDQVCATEKRRRRKRGKTAAADVAVVINERVCENCGDCSVQSNCIALEPVDTEFGRKRRVSPTACNTDLSCLKGFCPSFVTARTMPAPAGGGEAWLAREAGLAAAVPLPTVAAGTWRGLFAGIGGGGIVTCGAIVAMAAHLEGRAVSTLDFTGLAQKNGAVVSHVQVAELAEGGATGELDAVRIAAGEADVMIAADLAVAASPGVLDRCRAEAAVIGNLDLQPGAAFATQRDMRLDAGLHRRVIARRAGGRGSLFLRGAAIAERLFGNAQAMNTVLLGIAWQLGLLPVGEAALMRAMELNGTAVALNKRAFVWGRILAHQPGLADEIMSDAPRELPVAELVDARAAELVRYGSRRLARRFRRAVDVFRGDPGAMRAAAEGYFRVLAVKDEYEVARLHAGATYGEAPVFHMAPPLLSRTDPATGRKKKIAVPGRVALPLFRVLRHGKVLRGTPLDVFGWQAERREEREMIRLYEDDLRRAEGAANRDAAVALLRWPMDVRGFGPVKAASWAAMAARRPGMLAALDEVPAEVRAEVVAA